MEQVIIEAITAVHPSYAAVWELREQVLRQPLGMSLRDEDLSMDNDDTIVIALHQDNVIGCIMLHNAGDGVVKFRQMAVKPAWQGRGIGRRLMTGAEQEALRQGFRSVKLHARLVAAEFYTKTGYLQVGDLFTEVSIPHVLMVKQLS
jgi:predicted GNAT family N-acyltransferase